jgi:sulfite reductase alpha subunit-like flavoprotein
MFAMQLHQELDEQQGGERDSKDRNETNNLEILALNDMVGTMDASTIDHNANADDIHVILVSVTGVGEPPDNARKFYDRLMTRDSPLNFKYTLFGLGNSIAHPKHYNVIAKSMRPATMSFSILAIPDP